MCPGSIPIGWRVLARNTYGCDRWHTNSTARQVIEPLAAFRNVRRGYRVNCLISSKGSAGSGTPRAAGSAGVGESGDGLKS